MLELSRVRKPAVKRPQTVIRAGTGPFAWSFQPQSRPNAASVTIHLRLDTIWEEPGSARLNRCTCRWPGAPTAVAGSGAAVTNSCLPVRPAVFTGQSTISTVPFLCGANSCSACTVSGEPQRDVIDQAWMRDRVPRGAAGVARTNSLMPGLRQDYQPPHDRLSSGIRGIARRWARVRCRPRPAAKD